MLYVGFCAIFFVTVNEIFCAGRSMLKTHIHSSLEREDEEESKPKGHHIPRAFFSSRVFRFCSSRSAFCPGRYFFGGISVHRIKHNQVSGYIKARCQSSHLFSWEVGGKNKRQCMHKRTESLQFPMVDVHSHRGLEKGAQFFKVRASRLQTLQ